MEAIILGIPNVAFDTLFVSDDLMSKPFNLKMMLYLELSLSLDKFGQLVTKSLL